MSGQKKPNYFSGYSIIYSGAELDRGRRIDVLGTAHTISAGGIFGGAFAGGVIGGYWFGDFSDMVDET